MAKSEINGIDGNFVKDSIIGIIVGVAVIIMGFIIPGIGTIGVPSIPQSLSSETSRFIVVVILASIFETFFFFTVILSFFDNKLQRFGLKVPFIFASVISAVIFSLFHLSAYGNFGTSSGAFVSAFIIGLVFAYEVKLTNSALPAIFTHALLNWWIVWGSLSIVV